MTQEEQEAAITQRATADGTNAAEWFMNDRGVQGSIEYERNLLTLWIEKLTEDIDPKFEDELPSPRLSGEFADDPTWEDVYKEEIDESYPDAGADELFDLYCEVFNTAVHDEVVRIARSRLEALDVED